jgi:hypothetical protein
MMFGACQSNRRQCSAEGNDKRETVFLRKERRTRDEMTRRCVTD